MVEWVRELKDERSEGAMHDTKLCIITFRICLVIFFAVGMSSVVSPAYIKQETLTGRHDYGGGRSLM